MNPSNIIIAISLLLNAILVMSVVGAFPLFLFLSIVTNVALLFFIKNLFRQQKEIAIDSSQIFDSLESFEKHLQKINELEMFYGDETLGGLMDHMKLVADDMEEYCRKHEFILIQEGTPVVEEENIEEEEE